MSDRLRELNRRFRALAPATEADLRDEVTRLQSEVERLREMLADAEANWPQGKYIPGRVTEVVNPTEPYILRKQAEAVDEVNRRLTTLSEEASALMDSGLVSQYCASVAGEEAQRLRQQAAEIENG